MPIPLRSLWRNERGAVAPTVALSLIGLVAAGGIAFDYSRMASMDTELQNAADQAALAAASQLDGQSGACARAAAAASSLLTNNTLFANDGGGLAVTIANEGTCGVNDHIKFYQSYDVATETFGDPADSDSNALVVSVTVAGRTANYALTPIVGALSSGEITASAAASLASSICNTPPMMVCLPSGTSGEYPASADIGKGLRLQPGPHNGPWAPGNYGYLDFANGASGLATNLGKNNEIGGCVDASTGITTQPGNQASVTDALNSRFDLYPGNAAACNASTGDFCPSQNARKDLGKIEEVTISQPASVSTAPTNPGCGATGSSTPNADRDNNVDSYGFTQSGTVRGFTRDTCHTTGSCTGGNFGDGNWDRAGYFAALHPGELSAAATWAGKTDSTITRYDVHRWELASPSTRMTTTAIDLTDYNPSSPKYYKKVTGGPSGTATYTFRNRCPYPQPKNAPPGVATSATQKDRRLLSSAVVDCTGLSGSGTVNIKGWVDLYLVEPSLARTSPYTTSKEEIYVEIVGVAKLANGSVASQYYLRQRPRLIR